MNLVWFGSNTKLKQNQATRTEELMVFSWA